MFKSAKAEPQQQRVLQSLRVSRTKLSKNSGPGCTTGTRSPVPSAKELVLTFGAIRRSRGPSAKKRHKFAEALRLEETLFIPKEMTHVGKGEYTLYTNPRTGKVLGKSEKPSKDVFDIFTRNMDYSECTGIDRKIKTIQYFLLLCTEVRLTLAAAKLLRRVSIVFGSIDTKIFRRIVGRLSRTLRAVLIKESKLDTLPSRKPNRSRTGGVSPSKRRGVVMDPRYGPIPVLLT